MFKKNSDGFSFIEVLVSASILAVGSLGYMWMISGLSTTERNISDDLLASRVFTTVVSDLKRDSRYIPAYDEMDDTYFDEMYEDSLDHIGLRCYGHLGSRITPLPDVDQRDRNCQFLVAFYKSRVPYGNSNLRVPVAKFNIKIRYFAGPAKKNIDEMRKKEVILRPLITDVAFY